MEYWLQKKGLSGWSTVTWYADLEPAVINYKRAIDNGMSGYSWRVVEVKVVEQAMLEEVTEIEPPGLAPELAITPAGLKGWSKTGGSWGDHSGMAVPVGNINKEFGKMASHSSPGVPKSNEAYGWGNIPAKPEHGLTGSVWVIHHGLKHKARVAAGELELYLEKGYERGGPKTKFRE